MLRRWGCGVVLAFVSVLAAPAVYAQGDPCWRFTNCGSCAADAACGWCSALGRCMSGTQQGSPYCPSGWAWVDSQCPGYGQYNVDPCQRYGDCTSCANDANCGWCGATGHCLTGQGNGSPACPGGWAWTSNQCGGYGVYTGYMNADPCSRYQNCGACAQDANCGWCTASNRCMGGTAQGSPYCGGGWAWTANQCGGYGAVQVDRCSQYMSCGPCAQDPGCGWCGATGHCLSGSAQGSPYCPGYWAWTQDRCGYSLESPEIAPDVQYATGCSALTSCGIEPKIDSVPTCAPIEGA